MKLNTVPIPKRFMLHGQVINVILDDMLVSNQGTVGEARDTHNEIKLQSSILKRPQTQIEETFLHELVHLCLVHAGYTDLYKDEQFIDLLANMIHQAFATAEYK